MLFTLRGLFTWAETKVCIFKLSEQITESEDDNKQ